MARTFRYRSLRDRAGHHEEPSASGWVALSALGHAFVVLTALLAAELPSVRVEEPPRYVANLQPVAPLSGDPRPARARQAARERPAETERAAAPDPPPRAGEEREALPQAAPPARSTDAVGATIPKTPLPPAPPPMATEPPPRPPDPPRTQVAAARAEPAASPTAAAAAVSSAGPETGAKDVTRHGEVGSSRGASGLRLDVSDFPFTYYLRQIQAKISERWVPAQTARGIERTTVAFEIERDGSIKPPTVEVSSGDALYDQSALLAVVGATPFPPLPADFGPASLRVHLGFDLQPEPG